MKATPTAPLEMRKPDLLLEFLIIALDAPAQLRAIDQAIEGDVVGERRKPVFGRLDLALRPFNQQPFRRPWISALIIAMGDANAHARKARDQWLGRAFAPFDCGPSASSLTETGWCLASRRSRVVGRPRPDHRFGGSGAVPGAQTVVVDRMPAT